MMRVICGILAVAMLCTSALAGLSQSGVYNGWSGTVSFTDVNLPEFSVDVEYAVYAPDQSPYGGSAGSFVYAYQLTNTNTDVLSVFSVQMLASNEAENIGTIDLGGVEPESAVLTNSQMNPGQAIWDFLGLTGSGMATSEISQGLVYESVNAPIWAVGTATDGGTSINADVPAPSDVIPEPATMSLLGLGAVALIRRRR